jgi:hypothetical protein
MKRDQLRYDALAEDWNRLRDYEREWRIFGERVGKFVLIVVVLWLASVLVGCDSPEKACDRWTATVKGYEYCISDPNCNLDASQYRYHAEAIMERERVCPMVRP